MARSVNGRNFWTRDVKADKATLRVLVIGAIHGDELSSASLALRWMAARMSPAGSGLS